MIRYCGTRKRKKESTIGSQNKKNFVLLCASNNVASSIGCNDTNNTSSPSYRRHGCSSVGKFVKPHGISDFKPGFIFHGAFVFSEKKARQVFERRVSNRDVSCRTNSGKLGSDKNRGLIDGGINTRVSS